MHGHADFSRADKGKIRLFGVGCLAAGLLCAGDSPAGRRVPLALAEGIRALPTAYGLPVVEVRDAPRFNPDAPLFGEPCPVQVRAIVTGEDRADSFAILGWGAGSAVVRPGQSIETPNGSYALEKLSVRNVELRGNGQRFVCPLASAQR